MWSLRNPNIFTSDNKFDILVPYIFTFICKINFTFFWQNCLSFSWLSMILFSSKKLISLLLPDSGIFATPYTDLATKYSYLQKYVGKQYTERRKIRLISSFRMLLPYIVFADKNALLPYWIPHWIKLDL